MLPPLLILNIENIIMKTIIFPIGNKVFFAGGGIDQNNVGSGKVDI